MADEDTEALGQLVQSLRKSLGMTQDELGTRAGYRAGAAVSISRFENGQITPGPDKLQGIAEALGMNPAELEQRAASLATQRGADRRLERPKDRKQRVDREVAEREEYLTTVNTAFKVAQGRVKVEFLTKLSNVGARIEGVHSFDLLRSTDTATEAESGMGPMPKQKKSIEDFSGAVAEGARVALMLSLLRGAKVLPVGGLAVPMIAAAATAAVSGVMIARRQQQERVRQVDRAVAELAATESTFAALMKLLPQASEILEYIAVHAGHALERWDRQIGNPAPRWEDLGEGAKERFLEFLEISGAAMDILTIDFDALAKIQDGDLLSSEVTRIDELLDRSHDFVASRV